MNRRRAAYGCVLICATALGVVISYFTARTLQLNLGRQGLADYASRRLDAMPQLVLESNRALAYVHGAHLPLCSDEQLTLIRRYVYKSAHVRQIGLYGDGNLECTSGLGRLPDPGPIYPAPDITVDSVAIWMLDHLQFAKNLPALLVVQQDVSVVLNPDSYRDTEAPRFSSGFVIDPHTLRTLLFFGDAVALSPRELAAGAPVERNGMLFQPRCSMSALICVVARERRADLLATTNSFFVSLLMGGTLLGLASGAVLMLLHLRYATLERQLRRAVRRDSLNLVYQPLVELSTRKVIGAEALVRWVNDSAGPISPEIFIPLAEEKGFVREITALVLRKATRELGPLLAGSTLRLTINVSTHDLANPDLFELLEQCTTEAALSPANVGLEITERGTAEPGVAIEAIARLKRAGYTVYIDDFGTGYSNLAYLHQLAADAIKIDRVFTHMVGTESIGACIAPQLLDMARKLKLAVIVEGIETEQQAEYFRNVAPDVLAQGFLFSRGVPATQLQQIFSEGFLATSAPALAQQRRA